MSDQAPEYVRVNRANWDERAPAHAASPDYDVARVRRRPRAPQRRGPLRPAAAGRHHAGCAACTCSATSAPTRSRSPGSARAMTGLDFSRAGVRAGPPARRGRAAPRRLRRVRRVRRARRARPGRLRPRLHRDRGAVLAAGHPALGRGRRRAAAARRPAVHPRGPPDAVGASTTTAATGCCVVDFPYFERPEPLVWTTAAPTCETDARVRAQRRPTAGTTGSARSSRALLDRGPAAHHARGARQRPVGRAARPDGRGRAAASGGWPTGRGGSPHSYTLQAVKA